MAALALLPGAAAGRAHFQIKVMALVLMAAMLGAMRASAVADESSPQTFIVVHQDDLNSRDGFQRRSTQSNLKRITATAHNGLLKSGGLYLRVDLGTPRQITHLALDTLSAEPMWVIGADSPSAQCIDSSKLPYDPSKSTTMNTNKTEMTLNSAYIEGTIQGFLVSDDTHFGSYNLKQQSFVVGETLSGKNSFCDSGSSGSIPLNPSLYTKPGIESPLVRLAMQSKPKTIGLFSPIISAGKLIIGGINKSEVNGSFISFPQPAIPGQTIPWILSFDLISIGDISLSTKVSAIIDSTIPYLIIPDQAFMKLLNNYEIYNLTDDSVDFGVSCGAVNTFPPIVFHSGNATLSLDASFWISQKNVFCRMGVVPNPPNSTSRYTNLGLDSHLGDSDVWVLGSRFLASFYSEYQYSHNKTTVSIAKATGSPAFHCVYHVWCIGDYESSSLKSTYRCTDFFDLGLKGTGIAFTMYDPLLTPISLCAALVGFLTFFYILMYVSTSAPNRLQYMVCFFSFGCMNTAGTVLHCFTNEETTLEKYQLSFYTAYFDDLFTAFTDASYAFCGLFDIALVLAGIWNAIFGHQAAQNELKLPLLPKSTSTKSETKGNGKVLLENDESSSALQLPKTLSNPIVLIVYIGVYVYLFYIWTNTYFVSVVNGDFDRLGDVTQIYYKDLNQYCPIIFLACQVVYMIYTKASLKTILLLVASAGIGLFGLKLELSPDVWREVCNTFDAYVGLEEIWYFCSGTSIFLLGRYFLSSHKAPSQSTAGQQCASSPSLKT